MGPLTAAATRWYQVYEQRSRAWRLIEAAWLLVVLGYWFLPPIWKEGAVMLGAAGVLIGFIRAVQLHRELSRLTKKALADKR